MAGLGTDARPLARDDWHADWAPLREVVPPDDPQAAELTITFVDTNVPLGIEGAVLFAKLTTPDGAVVMDQRVAVDGPALRVPQASTS